MTLSACLSFFASPFVHASPNIISDTDIATAGYFQLLWEADTNEPVRLETDTSADFSEPKTIYVGSARSRTVTGLEDGDYFYRIVVSEQLASSIIKVRVQHHSLQQALAFFGLGATMFAILLFVLIKARKGDGN